METPDPVVICWCITPVKQFPVKTTNKHRAKDISVRLKVFTGFVPSVLRVIEITSFPSNGTRNAC